MFTGRPHAEHGVKNWKTSHSTHRKVKALWDITSESGLVTNVFNVPSTWPPTKVNGVMMSGFPLSGSHVGGGTGRVVSRQGISRGKAPGIYRENEGAIAKALAPLPEGDWSPWFDVALRRDPDVRGRMKAMGLAGGSVYLSPFYRVDPGLVISYPADLRRRIAAELVDDYIPEGPGWSRYGDEETPEYLYEHLVQVSRIQTRAASLFTPGEWDLFIYVNTLVDRVSHPYWAYMQPGDYEGLDPDKARRFGSAVKDAYRETDRQLGDFLSGMDGPYYVVIASDHGFKSSLDRSKHIGTHHFDGVYLISGPGLGGGGREGATEAAARGFIEDLAPTVLYLLGLPVADDMSGGLLGGLDQFLAPAPAAVVSYEGSRGLRGSDRPVDEATWEQLRGLGYVE
jgi:hypothetical protein